jgi:hypothetical protein
MTHGMKSRHPAGLESTPWRGFVAAGAVAFAFALALSATFILALDPYGRRAGPDRRPSPIMDINQRYMYPQLARSGLFDSAVFGTSTTRLLDPRGLSEALGGRFANLAINAGTPWEQLQLAELFLRHVPAPRTLILGLDAPWCDPAADEPDRRVTFRSFPPWLYDDDPINDLPHLINRKTAEIAGRVALNRLGWMPARIRSDGYEVFTPPEATYDVAKAREKLRSPFPGMADASYGQGGERPAIRWLGDFIRRVPPSTRLTIIFPPVFAGQQPPEALDAACKDAVLRAVGKRPALVVDYRFRSGLTETETNFWDPLHYRLPIAAQIVDDLRRNIDATRPAVDDRYRVLSHPPGRRLTD